MGTAEEAKIIERSEFLERLIMAVDFAKPFFLTYPAFLHQFILFSTPALVFIQFNPFG